MKRTSTISLGGMNFNIDDDAYEMLNQYFIDLSKRFAEDEKEEILRDIESRMAELFTFKMKDRNVINADDVNEVIDVIGHPDQFDDESGNSSEVNSSKENHAEEKKNFTGRSRKEYRKLYRNGTDKIIGGVASGLAAYFDLDPVVMRILFVVLAFASLGWGILIYLIFLIAMPEAITKAELLEMQGIEPNLENIDNFSQTPVNPKRSSTFWNIIKAILIIKYFFTFRIVTDPGYTGESLIQVISSICSFIGIGIKEIVQFVFKSILFTQLSVYCHKAAVIHLENSSDFVS